MIVECTVTVIQWIRIKWELLVLIRIKTAFFYVFMLAFFQSNDAQSRDVEIKIKSILFIKYEDIAASEWKYGRLKSPGRSVERLLRVTFTTSPELNSSNFEGFNIISEAYPCELKSKFNEANASLVVGQIIANRNPLEVPFKKTERDAELSATSIVQYHIYLSLRSNPNELKFNLFEVPRDICIKLSGGKMWFGQTIKTNVQRIARKSLEEAMSASK
jgi:hypothetical protein